MEAVYQSLVDLAIAKYDTINATAPGSRLLIAIAGPPGSGKTTSAKAISTILNARSPSSPPAIVVSMDGYHYPRSYLDTLDNREEAYIRRGAPWTFDSAAVVRLVHQCRADDGDIYVPTFDHALKDPTENGLCISAATRIIIFEGNYLLLNEKPWSEIKSIIDASWLVSVDENVARQRVAERHLAAGIEPDMEKALERVDRNDTLNGRYILEHSQEAADVIIKSIDVPV